MQMPLLRALKWHNNPYQDHKNKDNHPLIVRLSQEHQGNIEVHCCYLSEALKFPLPYITSYMQIIKLAYLTAAVYNILPGRKCLKPHRTSGVKLLCTYPDLSAESEFKSVCKSC